jgi:pilus assembly protein FimV
MAREQQGSPAGEKRLEQYGVWVKVKPRRVLDTPEREDSFRMSDLDTPRGTSAPKAPAGDDSALTAEEEKLLDDLETELDGEKPSADVLVPEEEPLLAEEEGELPDIENMAGTSGTDFAGESDEELPSLEEAEPPSSRGHRAQRSPSEGEIEVTLSENAAEEERFDDLEALESELATVAAAPRANMAGSSEVLSRIEDELRSIRTDLTQLRNELSGLRKGAASPAAESPAAGTEAQGGFFDEDEDETIALTGDELDNILNTADITEESAEAAVESEPDLQELTGLTPPSPLQEDILSFDTPSISDGNLEVLEKDIDLAEELPAVDDALDLTEGLSRTPGKEMHETAEVTLEELPSELVLEESAPGAEDASLSASDGSTVSDDLNIEELSELDLEGIPEVEAEAADLSASPEPVPAEPPLSEESSRSDETIDLATLDLGEEPTVIEAVPEQVEDFETIPEAESLEELDADSGTVSEEASDTVDSVDALTEEVDLEALAAEAEELTSDEVTPPADDLEIGELEGVSDEDPGAAAVEEEIEIPFEAEGEIAAELGADSAETLDLGPAEQVLDAEELPEAEEASEAEEALEVEESPAAKKATGGGIPAHLQDEIRTVLKYMDHLLEALPDEKIKEFASSDYFVMYKKLFEDLGLGE